MKSDVSQACAFQTERLVVGPWHEVAASSNLDLAVAAASLITVETTANLPDTWPRSLTPDEAAGWIRERNAESPTLLAVDRGSSQAVGLMVLAEFPNEHGGVDLRIGYVIGWSFWGQGLASELVAGLAAWANTHPSVHSLIGEVDPANQASARVLSKAGFTQIQTESNDGSMITCRRDCS